MIINHDVIRETIDFAELSIEQFNAEVTMKPDFIKQIRQLLEDNKQWSESAYSRLLELTIVQTKLDTATKALENIVDEYEKADGEYLPLVMRMLRIAKQAHKEVKEEEHAES